MVPNRKRRLLGQLPIVLAADLVGVLVSRVARAIAARLRGRRQRNRSYALIPGGEWHHAREVAPDVTDRPPQPRRAGTADLTRASMITGGHHHGV
jgi:hypothetical protein